MNATPSAAAQPQTEKTFSLKNGLVFQITKHSDGSSDVQHVCFGRLMHIDFEVSTGGRPAPIANSMKHCDGTCQQPFSLPEGDSALHLVSFGAATFVGKLKKLGYKDGQITESNKDGPRLIGNVNSLSVQWDRVVLGLSKAGKPNTKRQEEDGPVISPWVEIKHEDGVAPPTKYEFSITDFSFLFGENQIVLTSESGTRIVLVPSTANLAEF